MRKLWFNQSGSSDNSSPIEWAGVDQSGNIIQQEEEEDAPDFGLGDTIDKFDDNPQVKYSHDFGPDAIPQELQWNEQGEHCEFIYTENDNIQTDMNFAKTQEEIDGLYGKLDKLYEVWDEEGCF